LELPPQVVEEVVVLGEIVAEEEQKALAEMKGEKGEGREVSPEEMWRVLSKVKGGIRRGGEA
jgi:hypothetical protein